MKRILVTLLVLLSIIALTQFSPNAIIPVSATGPSITSVTLTAPTTGTIVTSLPGVTLTGKVVTSPSSVEKDVQVTVTVNSVPCGTGAFNATSTGTFSCNYSVAASGTYTWRAKAEGATGGVNMTDFTSATFTFTTPSITSVTLTAPATGTALTSTYITLTGKVAASTTTVLHEVQAEVKFAGGGTNTTALCPIQNVTATGTFSCNYNVEENGLFTWNATAMGEVGGVNMTTVVSSAFTFTAGPVVQNITLVAGWNLISLPVIPASTAIGSVLASQAAGANLTSVWSYQGGIWKYATLNPTTHTLSGSLTTMQDGFGYWIYMTKPDTLTVIGRVFPLPPATPPSYSLSAGWNLIGFKPEPTINTETVSGYLTSISGSYDTNNVWVYNNPSGTWSRLGASDTLSPGDGLWIYVSAAKTLYP